MLHITKMYATMPKLFQINSTVNWGSTGRIAEQIGVAAMNHGWESYIAYGRNSTESRSHLFAMGSSASRAWHLALSRLLDRHGLGSRCATKHLVDELRRVEPDIIHLHNLHGYYLNYPTLFDYLKSCHAKVVWTLHDSWAYTGHCSHYITTGCRKWVEGCKSCDHVSSYPRCFDLGINHRTAQNFELKQRLFTSLSDRLVVVPVSDWLATECRQSLFKDSTIETIHNGIDIGTFRPVNGDSVRQKHDIGNRTLLLFVANVWTEKKGWSDIFRLREHLSDDYAMVVVGVTHEQQASLPRGVVGVCHTKNVAELAEYYSAADIAVSLSRQETFGLTIAEAMACGTPVIIYNTTAMPELITPETGMAVDGIGDIEAMAEAIHAIRSHGKAHYAEACRKRAEEHFDKDICFEHYIKLYDKLLTT